LKDKRGRKMMISCSHSAAILVGLFCLSACDAVENGDQSSQKTLTNQSAPLPSTLPLGQNQITDGEVPASPEAVAKRTVTPSLPPTRKSEIVKERPDLCWQDYCPCDPIETTTDKWICRNLRGGVAVPDDVMSLGAMQRDSERSIRQYNQNNPDQDPIVIPTLPGME
jgi:hypothetical protein